MVNFSAVSDKSRLGKLLRFPLRLVPNNVVVPILQGRLRGKKWISGAANHSCWLGSFECDKQKLFSDAVSVGRVVYDIGAHVGFYTLLAAELVGPNGSVIAFEPNPRNLGFLKRHVTLNRCTNVGIIEAAVSARSGKAFFDASASSAMGHLALDGRLEVHVVCIDELIAKGIVPVPDYIKLDVEGAELAALTGARATLAAHHPVIFLATHGREVHEQCCSLLTGLGYYLKSITNAAVEATDEIIAYPVVRQAARGQRQEARRMV